MKYCPSKRTLCVMFVCLCIMPLLTSCTPPADPISVGQLCLPARDGCPNLATIRRSTPFGRNAVDLLITNKQNKEVDLTIIAGPSELFSAQPVEDMSTDMSQTPNTQFEFLGVRQYQTLEANASIQDRFVPSELGRDQEIIISAFCESSLPTTDCDVTVDYVVILEANECRANEDCDGQWICDTSRGECVECTTGGEQCANGQSCELGRCQPERVSSCAHTPTSSTTTPLWFIGLLALVLWRRKKRKRISSRTRHTSTPCLLILFCVLFGAQFIPTTASAKTPTARIHVGMGTASFTGDVGDNSTLGLDFFIGQELRNNWFGLGLYLHGAYYTTTQKPPPGSNSLTTYSAQFTPMFFWAIGPIELLARGGYERMGLAGNSLIRITGDRLTYNALVAGIGAQWILSPLEVRLEGQWHWIADFPGQSIGVNLSIGFGGL